MNNWRYKLFQFMQGRYGMDDLGRFLLILTMIIILASNFRFLHILYLPGVLLLAYTYFRIMSRNIYKRQQENQKYMALKYKFSSRRGSKTNMQQGSWSGRTNPGSGNANAGYGNPNTEYKDAQNSSLSYNFYRCRNCGQTVRVPKGKGTLKITCPSCGNSFIDRT
ncbi:MAG: hypothetical protein HFE76_12635 [Firmicutes bacterium]|nr:hypothetical protein [Bacillota bacterium]